MKVYVGSLQRANDIDGVEPLLDLVHIGDANGVDLDREALVVLEDDDHVGGGGAEGDSLEVHVLDVVQRDDEALRAAPPPSRPAAR